MRSSPTPARLCLVLASLTGIALATLFLARFFPVREHPHPVAAPPVSLNPPPRDPVRVDVIAPFADALAEEVERQVTIPLEVTLAGLERLEILRSKSMPGLAYLQVEFGDGITEIEARQKIIERLRPLDSLPAGVFPQIALADSPTTTFRYTLHSPRDAQGRDVYALHDLRTLQSWTMRPEFLCIPRIGDVLSSGGTVRRYEIHPDPLRLLRFSLTLRELESAIRGDDVLANGRDSANVRDIGLFGGGKDPLVQARACASPAEAAAVLRAAEQKRVRALRKLVVTRVNGIPLRVEDVVEGGPLPDNEASTQGVLAGQAPRAEHVGVIRAIRDEHGNRVWDDIEECVQGVIQVRPGEETPVAFAAIRAKIEQLRKPGRLLPGVLVEQYLEGIEPEHFWVRAGFPLNFSEENAVQLARQARRIVRGFAEVERVVSEVRRPEAEPFPPGPWTGHLCVLLRPAAEWPGVASSNRPRTKTELMDAVAEALSRQLPGVGWDSLSEHRHDLAGEMSGSAEEVVLRIAGPDLDELEKLAGQAKSRLEKLAGVRYVRILHARGLPRPALRIDPARCKRWGINGDDVRHCLRYALEGNRAALTNEGLAQLDITLRWPEHIRRNQTALLDLPLNLFNRPETPLDPLSPRPQLRLRNVVVPPDGKDAVTGPIVAAIYREQGQRVLLLRIGVRGRAQSAVCSEGERGIAPLLGPGYRQSWSRGR